MLGFLEDARYGQLNQEAGLFESLLVLFGQLLIELLIESSLNCAFLLFIKLVCEGLFGGICCRNFLSELLLDFGLQSLGQIQLNLLSPFSHI